MVGVCCCGRSAPWWKSWGVATFDGTAAPRSPRPRLLCGQGLPFRARDPPPPNQPTPTPPGLCGCPEPGMDEQAQRDGRRDVHCVLAALCRRRLRGGGARRVARGARLLSTGAGAREREGHCGCRATDLRARRALHVLLLQLRADRLREGEGHASDRLLQDLCRTEGANTERSGQLLAQPPSRGRRRGRLGLRARERCERADSPLKLSAGEPV